MTKFRGSIEGSNQTPQDGNPRGLFLGDRLAWVAVWCLVGTAVAAFAMAVMR